jgi:predicted transcriptional regulator
MAEDKSLFVEFFGDYPVIRVLDFLIENDIFDYSKKDIGRNADVSWNTLEGFWKNLEETGVVSFTRKVGKAQMYKINKKNPVVKQLIELDNKLMKNAVERLEPEKEMALA